MEADQKQQEQSKHQIIPAINDRQLPYFDWNNRWLKGPQYAFILKNINAYSHKYGFRKFQYKTHPLSIYQHPINGMIYFIKGQSVGSDFGFPRVAKKKTYRWKKMNFTTDLPKQQPQVTYVVASAIKSQLLDNEIQSPNFRMHAVILHKDRLTQCNVDQEYILCHVRKVDKKQESDVMELKDCFKEGQIDFYKLFVYLQNFSLKDEQK